MSRRPKLGQVPVSGPAIVLRPLRTIRPSPENDQLYRPVQPDDLAIESLAESIRERGILEPLVLTKDGYILSGHRRHAAAKKAGLTEVPCRIEDVVRDGSSEFIRRLREYNRQRVKAFDEILREEVVSADPEESYEALLEHRRASAQVTVETLPAQERKQRCRISRAKEPFLRAILSILDEQRDYWPFSDRRIHYQLLNRPPLRHASKPESVYRNDQASYKALCELLTRARLAGRIPMVAIADETRPVVTWEVHANTQAFLRQEVNGLFKGYWRDLMQSQPNHIEIVGEKNTIKPLVDPVAMKYCIPTTIGRGYMSLAPRHDIVQRYFRSGKERLVVLIVSDFDPEGEDIAQSLATSIRDDFGVANVDAIKVALTHEQVQQLALPKGLEAKKTSARFGKFVAKYGHDVYELESLHPSTLQALLTQAIDSVVDVEALNHEIDQERLDSGHLDERRGIVHRVLASTLNEHE